MRTENSRSTLGRSVGGAPTGNQQEINTESTTIGSGRGEYLSVGCVFMVVAEWEGGLRTSDDDDDGVSSIGIEVEGILFVDCCIVEIIIIDLSLAALS